MNFSVDERAHHNRAHEIEDGITVVRVTLAHGAKFKLRGGLKEKVTVCPFLFNPKSSCEFFARFPELQEFFWENVFANHFNTFLLCPEI